MAKRTDNSVDVSYRQWASSLDRSVLDKAIEEAAAASEEPKPMPRSYRPYAPRKPSKRALEEADEASFSIDEAGDSLSVDQRLERLTERIIRRMELDLQYFSVPQLLTGIQRMLQVRVLLVTLQQKGGGSSVGSAVRKYSTAFQPQDDAGHGKGGRRPEPVDDNNIVDLILADTDDDYDDEPSRGNAKPRSVAAGRARSTRTRG